MDFRDFLLNEMLVHRLGASPYTNFIAFRGHLWLFDETTKEEAIDIAKTILKEHPQRKNIPKFYEKRGTSYTNTDIEEWVRENIQDAFTGNWDAKKKTIWMSDTSSISPATSPLIKKVVQALGARSVQYESSFSFTKPSYDPILRPKDIEYWDRVAKFGPKKTLGQITDVAYHGTATEYLPSILKYGLMPGQAESNYGVIAHDDVVFLAFKHSEAEHHAAYTASRIKSYPVILKIKIPDRALLLPDYDIDKSTAEPTYPDFTGKKPNEFSSVDPMKASKHAGLFGYRGRIPANFIEGVYLRLKGNWQKVNLDTLRNRMTADPYEWQYKYGMF